MEFVDSSVVEQIEMKMIRPSQFAIRDKFQRSHPDCETLVNSIREHGLLQPILIRPLEHGFEIVAGPGSFKHAGLLGGGSFRPKLGNYLTSKHMKFSLLKIFKEG